MPKFEFRSLSMTYDSISVFITDSPSGPPTHANNQKQECTAVTATTDTNEANEIENSSARNFGFRDLAMATKNFRRECLLGESRVGKVYKGTLPVTGQVGKL